MTCAGDQVDYTVAIELAQKFALDYDDVTLSLQFGLKTPRIINKSQVRLW